MVGLFSYYIIYIQYILYSQQYFPWELIKKVFRCAGFNQLAPFALLSKIIFKSLSKSSFNNTPIDKNFFWYFYFKSSFIYFLHSSISHWLKHCSKIIVEKHVERGIKMSCHSIIMFTLLRTTKSDVLSRKEPVTHHHGFFSYGISNHHYV